MSALTLTVAAFLKLFMTILVLQDAVEGPPIRPKLKDPKIRKIGVACGDGCYVEGDGKKVLWHATNLEAARAILGCDRFDPGKKGKVGGAIYFGQELEVAMDRSVQGNGAVMKATVHLGCMKEVTTMLELRTWRPRTLKENKAELAKAGCDSFKITLPLSDTEFAVYNGDQVTDIEAFTPQGDPLNVCSL